MERRPIDPSGVHPIPALPVIAILGVVGWLAVILMRNANNRAAKVEHRLRNSAAATPAETPYSPTYGQVRILIIALGRPECPTNRCYY